ncbi:hypothetical protein Poli38472_005408 [Pythium oligandrum]|uniref:3'-5' exonuclease domain-containing protein n=1 Tax=Pythium oligandrum TaxID=41045 RepID=A0A8K1FGH9_PYTOL|nr:hypothetical protein Poli38472_005408 [Pythium oligandrum]|eukprot:TMW62790.1 hypothetical protein Poli38472_005408 [Pythium oligandrum]
MKAKSELMTRIHAAPLYTIARPDQVIHFVSTKQQWEQCEARLKAATIIGIDTETRPDFTGKRKFNPSSLLQLGIRTADMKEEVIILDLLSLPPKVYNATLSQLFLSKSIIKLGQGLFSDLKELAASYPAASCFKVAKGVVEVNDMSICLAGAHNPLSLQKLVYLYLHKRLTKTQQTSNWNRRPLSSSQLHYAACDALVLIHIYDVLMERLDEHTNGTFKIDSVANVLDVHVEAAHKCNLCFSIHDSKAQLKTHRQECYKNVRTLEICVECDCKLLYTAEDMERHVARCGKEDYDEADEPDSPVEVSEPIVSRKQSKKAKKKQKKQQQQQIEPTATANRKRPLLSVAADKASKASVTDVATITINESAQNKQPKKKKKKNKKKPVNEEATETVPVPKRQRKMSEGTLLASDDIWSEISMEHEESIPQWT